MPYLGHMTTATHNTAGQVPQWSVQDRLRKAREHAGMKQSELAAAIGISRNSVSNYESGTTPPRQIVLNQWSLATGVPLAWLTSGEGDDGVRHQGLEPRTRWFGGSWEPMSDHHPDEWIATDFPIRTNAA